MSERLNPASSESQLRGRSMTLSVSSLRFPLGTEGCTRGAAQAGSRPDDIGVFIDPFSCEVREDCTSVRVPRRGESQEGPSGPAKR